MNTKRINLLLSPLVFLPILTTPLILSSCNKKIPLTQKQKTLQNILSLGKLPEYVWMHNDSFEQIAELLNEDNDLTDPSNTTTKLVNYIKSEEGFNISDFAFDKKLFDLVSLAKEGGELFNSNVSGEKWTELNELVNNFKTKIDTIVTPEIKPLVLAELFQSCFILYYLGIADNVIPTYNNTESFTNLKKYFHISETIFNNFINSIHAVDSGFSSASSLSSLIALIGEGGVVYTLQVNQENETKLNNILLSLYDFSVSVLENVGAKLLLFLNGYDIFNHSSGWIDPDSAPFISNFVTAYNDVFSTAVSITTSTKLEVIITDFADFENPGDKIKNASASSESYKKLQDEIIALMNDLKEKNENAKQEFIDKVNSIKNKEGYQTHKNEQLDSLTNPDKYNALKEGWNSFSGIESSETIQDWTTYQNLTEKVASNVYFVSCEDKTAKWTTMINLVKAYYDSLNW